MAEAPATTTTTEATAPNYEELVKLAAQTAEKAAETAQLAATFSKMALAAAVPPGGKKPMFFDMVHSNNAARIRIWIACKGLQDVIETKMITYPDLQTDEFKAVNPLRKVPAYVGPDGTALFESYVILEYLADKYSTMGPVFKPPNPEDRARMALLIRIHDIYIASPNCTQPGFAHTQGCMYLGPKESEFCPSFRVMKRDRRAKKLAEMFKQLTWLEANISEEGPWMMGEQLTLADMTWWPTSIFMEYMLPRVYGWPDIFNVPEAGFPRLCKWAAQCKTMDIFTKVRQDIWDFWVVKDNAGQFKPIIAEVAESKQQDGDLYKWDFKDFNTTWEG